MRKDGGATQGRHEVFNMRNRVLVWYSDIIECPVVLTGSPVTWTIYWRIVILYPSEEYVRIHCVLLGNVR